MGEREIRAAFEDGPALVPYLVAGDPGPEETTEYVEALVRGGADVIELGLPFSEPIADGPTIESGIRRALDAGMTPSRYLDLVADLAVDVPIVTMTYYNLLFRYGDGDVEPFVADAAAAGVDGLIVPDLPVEESGPLAAACQEHGLALVFIVAPTTTDERIERIVERATGFVYVQARLGTTGARADVSERTYESLDRLPDVDGGADGVVAGSVFVDIVASGDDVARRLEATAAEIKAGAIDAVDDTATPEPERT